MRWAAPLLAGALIVGCADGGGGRVAPPSTAATASGVATGDADGTTSSTPALVPVVGGRLRLGLGRVASLDPAQASPDSPSAAIVADLLYDGLTEVPAGTGRARPAIAERWQVSPDGLSWLFSVSPGARFSDGRAVTAGDVQFSLERVLGQGAASLVAARLDAVESVVALDTATVQITLRRPMAWLPELLSAPAYGIVSQAGADTLGAAPAATSGPFRVAGRDGDVVSLERAPTRGGYVDEIELRLHADLAAALDAFEAGRLDWTLVPPSAVDVAAERFGTDGFRPFHAQLYLGFNLTRADGLFADVRFRQAIAQAVDRRAIVNAVYFGTATELATIVPAGVAGADRDRCAAGCAHDPEASVRLLRDAFPDGNVPTVPLDYADGADEAAVAGIIEQNLRAVGIPVELRPHPPSEFAAFVVSGEQGMVSLGWIGVGPTPEDYLERMYRSQSVDNLTGFADPEVDTLFGQAAGTLDPRIRATLLARAESAILAAAPGLTLAQFQVLSVASDRVHDLTLGVDGTFDGEAVWLSP